MTRPESECIASVDVAKVHGALHFVMGLPLGLEQKYQLLLRTLSTTKVLRHHAYWMAQKALGLSPEASPEAQEAVVAIHKFIRGAIGWEGAQRAHSQVRNDDSWAGRVIYGAAALGNSRQENGHGTRALFAAMDASKAWQDEQPLADVVNDLLERLQDVDLYGP